MRFGVFTDLHYDAIPDADKRVGELFDSFEKNNVDFVIDLGDSMLPRPENAEVVRRFKNLPCYFSIGNHNIDFCSNDAALRFFGLEKGNYSVLWENVKFIFLDANYAKTPGGYFHEDEASDVSGLCRPYVPPVQIQWLEKELAEENLFYIICSHQSLANNLVIGTHSRGILNREEIRKVLERRNAGKKAVLFCMNGHDHGDAVREINGIHYYSLNSASHLWQPKDIFAYDGEAHERFPHLKNHILYEEALHIIVHIDVHMNVAIQGMEGRYQRVTPKDAGMGYTWNNVSIKPRTSSVYIPWIGGRSSIETPYV